MRWEEGSKCKRSSANSLVGIKLSFRRYDAAPGFSPLTRSRFVSQFMPSPFLTLLYPAMSHAISNLFWMAIAVIIHSFSPSAKIYFGVQQKAWHHHPTPPHGAKLPLTPALNTLADWSPVTPPLPHSSIETADLNSRGRGQDTVARLDIAMPSLQFLYSPSQSPVLQER